MEDAETQAATDALEVVLVVGVEAGRRVNLEGVVVVRRVLEQTVEGVEHLVGEEEEELPVRTNVNADSGPITAVSRTWKDHRNPDHPRPRT